MEPEPEPEPEKTEPEPEPQSNKEEVLNAALRAETQRQEAEEQEQAAEARAAEEVAAETMRAAEARAVEIAAETQRAAEREAAAAREDAEAGLAAEMRANGLALADHERLAHEGVVTLAIFEQLTEQDFRACGIDLAARRASKAEADAAATAAAAAAARAAVAAAAAAATAQAAADAAAADVNALHTLLQGEGAAAGLTPTSCETILHVVSTLSDLCGPDTEQQLGLMESFGLRIADRRCLVNLLGSSPTVAWERLVLALPALSENGRAALGAAGAISLEALKSLGSEAARVLMDSALGSVDAALVAAVLAVPPPPLAWEPADGVDVSGEGGAVVTHSGSGIGRVCAVCGTEILNAASEAGAYAEFTWLGGHFTAVGLVRPGLIGPDGELSSSGFARGGAWRTPGAWMFFLKGGGICHAGDALPWVRGEMRGVSIGETVGLLLRNGALRVYLRSKRTGARVCAGVLCTGLVGELMWAADLYDVGDSVRLLRNGVPRDLTEVDNAAEAMQLPEQTMRQVHKQSPS